VIEIERGERILLGQDIADAVGLPGLHGRERGLVVSPGRRIVSACVPLRAVRLEGRLLPVAVQLLRPPPHRPLRPLDQRR
jgi:hypothetical protein